MASLFVFVVALSLACLRLLSSSTLSPLKWHQAIFALGRSLTTAFTIATGRLDERSKSKEVSAPANLSALTNAAPDVFLSW